MTSGCSLAYIGPGGGVTVGALLVIFIGGLVLFALGFIVWLRIKRFLRGQGKAKWGLKLLTQTVALLAVLSAFGWMAQHRAKKDRDFGGLQQGRGAAVGLPRPVQAVGGRGADPAADVRADPG